MGSENVDIQHLAETLLKLPSEWLAVEQEGLGMATFLGNLVLCHPDMQPIIFKDGKWDYVHSE